MNVKDVMLTKLNVDPKDGSNTGFGCYIWMLI